MENNYSKHDPVIKAGRYGKQPFIWNLTDETDPLIRKIMNERREYGMKSGITIPVLNRGGKLTSWLSLSTKQSQNDLMGIIKTPEFSKQVYSLHIKTVAYTLSNLTGIDSNFCYAIVLSNYTNRIEDVSEATGLLASDLYKLFGHLYLFQESLSFFTLDVMPETINNLKNFSLIINESNFFNGKFSRRQLECIELMRRGLTYKQAARKLGISIKTYEGYTSEIRQKLNCSNQRELIFKLSTGF